MTYLVQFDLFVDSDEIIEDSEMEDFIKEQLNSASINVKNCRIISVDD